jgi:SET family sugar efflux transporter-like MFS transporter
MFHPIRLLYLTASFFCGLGFAFMFPLISLYLVEELGSSPLEMGMFLAIQVSTGVFVSTKIGKYSDAGWSRKRIIVFSQLSFTAALLVFIFTRDYYAALAASVFLMSIASATLPQMFTLGRFYSDYALKSNGVLFMSLLRAAISVAWVIGPPLAFMVKNHFGFSYAFAIAIASALIMVVIVFFLPEYRGKPITAEQQQSSVKWHRSPPIFFYLLACLFMFSASYMYNTTIPLYVTMELSLSSQWAGYLMGTAAFLEIPFMVLAGIYGAKLGYKRLLYVGLFSGLVFYAGLLISNNIIILVALQFFNGVFIAIIATLGMILIQDMMKHEMGTATTLFNSAQMMSALVGSLVVGVTAQFVSYYAVFVVAIVLIVLAMLSLLMMGYAQAGDQVDESIATENTQASMTAV